MMEKFEDALEAMEGNMVQRLSRIEQRLESLETVVSVQKKETPSISCITWFRALFTFASRSTLLSLDVLFKVFLATTDGSRIRRNLYVTMLLWLFLITICPFYFFFTVYKPRGHRPNVS